jgi:hypothetical protein
MTDPEMDEIVAGLSTKADKIRALAAAGVSKGDIARYLGIIYQHVYNVLARSSPKKTREGQGGADLAGPLSIAQAKAGLAAFYGVPADAIEIIIRG